MISLIICSTTPYIDPILEKNIQETIGCEYEIVLIDNSNNKHNIFEAYNLGVVQSKYLICCFMHEDILYQTKNWGQNVIYHFRGERVGMIGVAGSKYLPRVPASWFSLKKEYMNIIQHYKKNDNGVKICKNPSNELVSEVVAADGVWFCIRKSLFKSIKFDYLTFKSFHAYDLDISFQVQKANHKIYVVYDVLIEHFSCGTLNIDWFLNILTLYRKWNNFFPLFVDEKYRISKNEEWWYFHNLLQKMKELDLDKRIIRKTLLRYYFKIPFCTSSAVIRVLRFAL